MENLRIFIDFGSTFTKVVAFDLEKEELAARVQAPSSVDTDITVGLHAALRQLNEAIPVSEENVRQALACSSAAGGLRMVCIGLVPEYTTEAGRLAALGAGAKVVGTYSYELSRGETEEIAAAAPDIILLTGGTDGGNKSIICHNARMLAGAGSGIKNIIVAGNKSASDEIREIFSSAGKDVFYAKNVMPEFGELD
ncbi:MAG: glutamate mutase L, partial [Clostridiales bacterium]|nr:glutamate mutase L [Clostridiales bacterium]